MRAYERLLKYVSVYTTSDPDSATVPSSMRQYDLANILVDELKALGLENVHVDENGVVYGWLSATAGCEQKPALGFIAHLDTAPDCSGENVKPQIIEHYDGGDVLLAGSGETLSPAAFPGLKKAGRHDAHHHGRHHPARRGRQGRHRGNYDRAGKHPRRQRPARQALHRLHPG